MTVARTLRASALIVSAGYLALYAVLAGARIRYPFELEWLEGAMVDHVRTILAGQALYPAPSLAFIPLTYTPGYFYLSAAVSAIFGVGFGPMRVVSIAASAGLLWTLYALTRRESGSRGAGLMAAGAFAATYGWTDGWFDLARNDSLFLCLAVLAIYVLRRTASPAGAALAGALIGAAFLVKQTGLVVGIPLAAYCAWRGWRHLAAYAAPVAAIVGGSTIVLDYVFDGWYRYYVFAVPAQHPLAVEMLWGFWRFDLLRPFPLATAASALYLIGLARRREWDALIFWASAGAGLLGGALASRLHSLSYVNVVLPAYAAVSVVGALAAHRAWQSDGSAQRSAWVPAAVWMAALLQLLRLGYNPSRLVPTDADVAAGHALLERIRQEPGEVFVPYHGYLPALAGKATHAHAVVIADVIRGGTSPADRALTAELDAALRARRFSTIISVDVPTPVTAWLPFERDYRPDAPVVEHRTRFWRRELRYVPRE